MDEALSIMYQSAVKQEPKEAGVAHLVMQTRHSPRFRALVKVNCKARVTFSSSICRKAHCQVIAVKIWLTNSFPFWIYEAYVKLESLRRNKWNGDGRPEWRHASLVMCGLLCLCHFPGSSAFHLSASPNSFCWKLCLLVDVSSSIFPTYFYVFTVNIWTVALRSVPLSMST